MPSLLGTINNWLNSEIWKKQEAWVDPRYCTGIIVIVFLAAVISCMFTIKKYHLLPKISLLYAKAVEVKLMESMIFPSFGNPTAVHDFSEILLMKWPYMK